MDESGDDGSGGSKHVVMAVVECESGGEGSGGCKRVFLSVSAKR